MLLLVLQTPAAGGDLKKIDRTIGKEPMYNSQPQYCLLVLGPDAKTRVWLVLDGATLYVSGNKGGALIKATQRSENGKSFFDLFVAQSDGKTTHYLRLSVSPTDGKTWEIVSRADNMQHALQQTIEGTITFADRAQTAPVVHLDGSYTSTLRERGLISKGQWVRARSEGELHVFVGSDVLQQSGSAFVRTWWQSGIPEQMRPMAEIEFPHRDSKKPPIKMRVSLVFR
jgi:hypothetical protein